MVLTERMILASYPLHYAIWMNNEEEVERLLTQPDFKKEHLEKLDPRGRTPLVLAVLKERVSIVDRLLNKHNADATFAHESGWNVIHEAVSTKHKDLIRMVLARRDLQRCQLQERLIPELLEELKSAPDFYVEMRWVFSTWVPYVSRMLPAGQSYRVFKKGSSLRVDTSSSDCGWNSGISLIFKEEGNDIFMFEVDHAGKRVLKQIICSNEAVLASRGAVANGRAYDETIANRLLNPSVVSVTDWKTVSFKRRQHTVAAYASIAGLGDLTEHVDGYKCKLFDTSGFGIQTKFRTEHLNETEKSKFMTTAEEKPGMLKRILSYLSKYDMDRDSNDSKPKGSPAPEQQPSAEEYFDPDVNLGSRDIGPPKEIKSKRIKFDATVWVCEEYPLDLKEQLVPIVNLMSLTNSRFKTLKDFIELQMPAGFPVKLQVPIYPMVNGQISFHNIFGSENHMDGVEKVEDEENGKLICILDTSLFNPPPDYDMKTAICFGPDLASEDDDFFGIFREGESNEPEMDIYEALNAPRTLIRDVTPDDAEEQMLQRAIEESLFMERLKSDPDWRAAGEEAEPMDGASAFPPVDIEIQRTPSYDELEKVIELSRAESEAAERNQREEEEMLRMVLARSLQEF